MVPAYLYQPRCTQDIAARRNTLVWTVYDRLVSDFSCAYLVGHTRFSAISYDVEKLYQGLNCGRRKRIAIELAASVSLLRIRRLVSKQ